VRIISTIVAFNQEATSYRMTQPSTLAYATQRAPLQAQIQGLFSASDASPVDFRVMAAIVPNSDDYRGGACTASVFKSLSHTDYSTVISVAPNAGEEFKRITICSLDSYNTPMGDVKVNDAVRNELCDEDDDIYLDDRGHFLRRGLDISLPFLQNRLDDFTIAPLVMGAETPAFCKELGSAIGEVMANQRTLVVASVDILEASEEGMERFQTYLQDLDVPSMMALLNQEVEIRVAGKGPLLVAMMASLHRRANAVATIDSVAPSIDGSGFVGALIGRM